MTGDPQPLVPKAKRLTMSEMLERSLTALTRTVGEQSTVRLTRNARGDTQIEVMVRTGDGDITTVDQARDKARAEYDLLCNAYPLSKTENGDGKV